MKAVAFKTVKARETSGFAPRAASRLEWFPEFRLIMMCFVLLEFESQFVVLAPDLYVVRALDFFGRRLSHGLTRVGALQVLR